MHALALAGLATASCLLVWSALLHLRSADRLRAALVAQRLVPYTWTRALSRSLPLVEGASGALGLAAVLGATSFDPAFTRAVAAAVAVTYGALAAYVHLQRRTSPQAPCGCFGDLGPATAAHLARAVVLSLAALGACLVLATPPDEVEALLGVAAAIPLTMVSRHLPSLIGTRRVLGVG